MEDKFYTICCVGGATKRYLRGIGLGCCNTLRPLWWTSFEPHAIRFNELEGSITIDFLVNVVDADLEGNLYL